MSALLPVRMPVPRPWAGGKGRAADGGYAQLPGPQIGVDLVPVSRLRRIFEKKDDRLREVFTEEELRYCTRQRRPFLHLAARFAAKEAVLKSLGTGLTGTMRWAEVETVHGPRGDPRLILRGEVARLAAAKGLCRCALSLTHAGDYALAAVLLTP